MATYQWRADAFQPMSDEYIYCFLEHEQQAIRGEYHAFDHSYLPRLRAQGVQSAVSAVPKYCTAIPMYIVFGMHIRNWIFSTVSWKPGVAPLFCAKPRTIWRVPNQRAKLQSLQHWLVAVRSKERPT